MARVTELLEGVWTGTGSSNSMRFPYATRPFLRPPGPPALPPHLLWIALSFWSAGLSVGPVALPWSLVSDEPLLLSFDQPVSNLVPPFRLLPAGPLSSSGWADVWGSEMDTALTSRSR